MRVTRRRFTRDLAAAGAGALVLPGLLRGPAHGQAKPGGQLTVALYKDLRTLNPIMGIFGNEWRSTVNLYNNLTRLTANGGVEGDLAESYTAGANSATWTFVLRDGVRFHGDARWRGLRERSRRADLHAAGPSVHEGIARSRPRSPRAPTPRNSV